MGRLLALPHDWTVCLQDLRRRWGCGLERLKRIMRELIAAGWVQRLPPRKLANGSFSRGDYKVFNIRQEVQDDLPLDGTEGAGGAASAPLESAQPESGDPESVGRTPNKGRTQPRTDSPKPNPPRETYSAPGRRPASAHADAAPDGALSLRAVLCPDDFQPEERHFAAAEAAGFDRVFVHERAEAIRQWSHANAHQPKAWKTDWSLAFDGMLKTALREAAEQAARAARRASSTSSAHPRRSTNGGLSLLAEMVGMPHDARDILDTLGLGAAGDASPTYGTGGPSHARLLEQA
ncbi:MULTISPECIES: hypothetical protein [unclassified Methylobacterium]|uniref:hypothetical protein n=1 Tax=unclassified Methylobacterium TaxID=2615210 RepID=UPI00226AD1C8|nr:MULTISPECIES: hypothetical protein [unclassified Methylobacterium]